MTPDLDQQITQALNNAPRVAIPADFAARVASRLPAASPAVSARPSYARRLAIISSVLLVTVLLALTAMNRGTSFIFTEILLATELALLTLWLAIRRVA